MKDRGKRIIIRVTQYEKILTGLAQMMERGHNPRTQAASRNLKRQENRFSPGNCCKECNYANTDFSPVRPISDFLPTEL